MNPDDEIDEIDEPIDEVPETPTPDAPRARGAARMGRITGEAPPVVPERRSTEEANAAWADSVGPVERAQLLRTALDREADPAAREAARVRTRYLVGRHIDQAMGTATPSTPIIGRDSRPTAGVTGAVQGATLGFADEIGGAIRALATGRTYEQERDALREEFARSREQAPTATAVGELGGGAWTMAIPGGGATAAERIMVQGGIGAGLGTVAGAGYSEADTAHGVAQDAALGGVVGGTLGVGSASLGEVGRAGADRLRAFASRADELRVASLMPGTSREIGESFMRAAESRPGGVPRLADDVRRMRLVSPFATAEDVAGRVDQELARVGERGELGRIYRDLDEIAPVDPQRLTGALERQAGALERDPVMRRFAGPVRSRIEDFSETLDEPISYQRAREILGAIGDQTNWVDPASGARPPQEVARGTYRELRRELDDIASEALAQREASGYRDPAGSTEGAAEAMAAFRQARHDTSQLLFADEHVQRALQRQARARAVSPTDYLAAMAGSQRGGLAGAALGAIANRAFRVRELPMQAAAAEMVGAALQSNPAALGQYAEPLMRAAAQGEAALASAHMQFSTRDPEYRRTLERLSEEAEER